VDGVREDVQRGELVVVSSEKGEELVEVLGYSKEGLSSKATFLRRAMEEDKRKAQENEERAKEYHQLCKRKIREYNLDMKLLKTYIPLDGSKVFFYYTAEQRVDFRALVRDLAKSLKRRIEMRQIGVRDAVQMMGWLGNCGNDACCAKFAEKMESVYVHDIHLQNLPLSPSKFTGPCGRLLCCLAYERENYLVKEILPDLGTSICYDGREYNLIFVEPLRGYALLEREGKKFEVPLKDLLPNHYERALEHCRACPTCCRRVGIDHEATVGATE
jgi:cell fate regulator YaaT (PSP1 superfamily)